jgi:hypothetical protein
MAKNQLERYLAEAHQHLVLPQDEVGALQSLDEPRQGDYPTLEAAHLGESDG